MCTVDSSDLSVVANVGLGQICDGMPLRPSASAFIFEMRAWLAGSLHDIPVNLSARDNVEVANIPVHASTCSLVPKGWGTLFAYRRIQQPRISIVPAVFHLPETILSERLCLPPIDGIRTSDWGANTNDSPELTPTLVGPASSSQPQPQHHPHQATSPTNEAGPLEHRSRRSRRCCDV
jgi:hypothetical protein